jgi:hypothetical protein
MERGLRDNPVMVGAMAGGYLWLQSDRGARLVPCFPLRCGASGALMDCWQRRNGVIVSACPMYCPRHWTPGACDRGFLVMRSGRRHDNRGKGSEYPSRRAPAPSVRCWASGRASSQPEPRARRQDAPGGCPSPWSESNGQARMMVGCAARARLVSSGCSRPNRRTGNYYAPPR